MGVRVGWGTIITSVLYFFFFLMIRRPPTSTQSRSSAASDVYKRQALRYLPWLSDQGWIITNSEPFINISNYPPADKIIEEIRKITNNIVIDADKIAKETGSARAGNIVVLGAASPFISIPYESLENGVRKLFGKKGEEIVEMNLRALKAGRDFTKKNSPK